MRKTYFLICLIIAVAANAQEQKKVNFDKKFQKEYQGKAKVDIHEVKELLHIMIAVTETGLENDDMVDQSGAYYQDVLQQFRSLKDEKIITKFDSLIKANPTNYVILTGNAISYDFNGDQLVPDRNYLFPAQSVSSHTKVTVNPITTYQTEIENFAKKSGFRDFYKKHLPVYRNIVAEYNTMANLDEQWKWLEKNFNSKINNYTILTSPLINGLNYTTSYNDNNFTQIMMVLPPIVKEKGWTEKENAVYNTRIMLTEIDHNYVGPPTKKFAQAIEESLKDREKWVNTKQEGTQYYPNPSRVFDEYMTFSVFYLFCADQYARDPETLSFAYNSVNSVMKERGFIKMKEFNDQLMTLRKKYPHKKIDDLYPELLEWCKNQ